MTPRRPTSARNVAPRADRNARRSVGLADLHTAPGHLFRRARQFHDALWLQEVGDVLTPLQFAALTALDAEPGLNQRELGERIALDKSTLGDVVARLDRRGYICREPDPADARSRLIMLTSDGRAVLEAARPSVEEIGTQMLACLDVGERGELLRLLEKLVFSDAALDRTPKANGGNSHRSADR